MHTVLKLAQLRWTGHDIKCLMSDFQRKPSMANYKRESAVKEIKEQLSMKKKRICEAERKRRERKANTDGSPAESMTMTWSTYNRKFRASIGLVRHQRTHQHT